METVLKIEHGAPGPFSKCNGALADASARRQVLTTQVYLKEVGSDNTGAPAHQSRRARVPPYPMEVKPANPPGTVPGPFIDPEHVLYDITDDVIWQHYIVRTRRNYPTQHYDPVSMLHMTQS